MNTITADSAPVSAERRLHHCPECCGVGTGPTHHPKCSRAHGCWADDLTRAGRISLAGFLARAAHDSYVACQRAILPPRALTGQDSEPAARRGFLLLHAECADLRTDVTERAAEATS